MHPPTKGKHTPTGNNKTQHNLHDQRGNIILPEQHEQPHNRIPASTLQIGIPRISQPLKWIPKREMPFLYVITHEKTVRQITSHTIPLGYKLKEAQWINRKHYHHRYQQPVLAPLPEQLSIHVKFQLNNGLAAV
jgi:hypothetical protein